MRAMKRLREDTEVGDQLVWLNVGGTKMLALMDTLRATHFPDSLLAVWFAPEAPWQTQLVDGEYFVDYDPQLFALVLRVLRCPPLRDCVPQGLTEEAWHLVLDYWGLLPPTTATRCAKITPSELQRLGTQIRNDIVQCEQDVVMALLRETGYLERRGKMRDATLYVPQTGYMMPWGADLYDSLLAREKDVKRVLHDMLPGIIVTVAKNTSHATRAYRFAGHDCTTADGRKTVVVTLNMEYCK